MEKQKINGIMKDELGGTIIKEFSALKTKTCSYLTNNNGKYKKEKAQKMVS